MKTIFLLGNLIMVGAVCCAGDIITGSSVPGFRFPIYAPEPSNPYVQIMGNSSLSEPGGSTVYHGALLAGPRYQMEFWIGPATATSFSELTLIRTAPFRNVPATPEALPNGLVSFETRSVPGLPAGSLAKLGIRVWDTESGVNFDSALIRGQGALFLSAPLGGLSPVNNDLFLPPNWRAESFSLVIVPEPTSMALAGLGAATLLIFRRRK